MSNDNDKPREEQPDESVGKPEPKEGQQAPPLEDGIRLVPIEDDEDATDDLSLQPGQEESALEARLRQVSSAYVELQNEMQAFRERNERIQTERDRRRRGEVVMAMFEPVQNLRRSLDSWKSLELPGDATQGLELVLEQFQDALRKLGLEAITAAPADFNPNIHDAICAMPVKHASLDGKVIQVFEAGYRVGDLVIQAARVIVGRYEPPVPEEEEPQQDEAGAEE